MKDRFPIETFDNIFGGDAHGLGSQPSGLQGRG
jgi:hypothetical protein